MSDQETDPEVMANPGLNLELDDLLMRQFVDEECMSLPDEFRSYAIPDEVDPRKFHDVESQGSMGSCTANATTSAVERLWWVSTKGEKIGLSRIWMYIMAQHYGGGARGDRGSSVVAAAKVAKEVGCPTEQVVPYPSPVRYPSGSRRSEFTSGKYDEYAKPYRVRSFVKIQSHEEAVQYIGGGGACVIGIAWPPRYDSGWTVRSFSGGGRGGHALAPIGYKRNGDIIFANSHGTRAQDGGYFYVTPEAFEQMLRSRSYGSCIGYSDMLVPQPRRLDFTKVLH